MPITSTRPAASMMLRSDPTCAATKPLSSITMPTQPYLPAASMPSTRSDGDVMSSPLSTGADPTDGS